MKIFSLSLLIISCFSNIYAQNAYLVGPWNNNIKSITASSELENRYLAQNLIDNSYRSWAEGVDGNGIGEYFTIEFKSLSKISGFGLKNGYGQLDYYFKNNRVMSFEILFDDNKYGQIIDVKDTYEFEQYILIEPIECTKLTFKINSIYQGTLYNDTCIAEICPIAYILDDYRFYTDFINRRSKNEPIYVGDNFTRDLILAAYNNNNSTTRVYANNEPQVWIVDEINVFWTISTSTLINRYIDKYWRGHDGSGEDAWYGIFYFENISPILIETSGAWFHPRQEKQIIKIKKYENNQWVEKYDDDFSKEILSIKQDIEQKGMIFNINIDPYQRTKLLIEAREKYDSEEEYDLTIDPIETIIFSWDKSGFVREK
jgi:hypothetical protein